MGYNPTNKTVDGNMTQYDVSVDGEVIIPWGKARQSET
jgi:hypothetical protein